MMVRIRAGVNTTRENWLYAFSREVRRDLAKLLDFDEKLIAEKPDAAVVKKSVRGAEVVLGAWNAVPFTEEVLEGCPDLKLIVYAGGSVKGLVTEALVKRNVRICSAVRVNAVPVAQFTLGVILMALRRVFGFHHDFLEHGREAWKREFADFQGGYYKTRIGLVGFGEISRHLMVLLRDFDIDVYVVSSRFTQEHEIEYRARRASLEWVMANCQVVSLHAADIPRNVNLINRENLKLMRPGAALVNTSRGRLIKEEDLVDRLREGGITAFLDVTYPEPPEQGHPFYTLTNCILTPHLAGSIGLEVSRMGDFCLRQLQNWLGNRELEGEVSLADLADRA